MTRIGCLSDLHGVLPSAEEIRVLNLDLLLISGDVCPHFARPGSIQDELKQAEWLKGTFDFWIRDHGATTVWIAGNHDYVCEHIPRKEWDTVSATYLNLDSTEECGLTIWGNPWTPWFFSWAFNYDSDPFEYEKQAQQTLAHCPENVDIILSHGPPKNCLDLAPGGDTVGCYHLKHLIQTLRPKLVVCGHIHCARGIDKIGDTIIVNASFVDERYRREDSPIFVVEL